MKTLILSALIFAFGSQFAFADSEAKCHQCHDKEVTQVRVVREFR